MGRLARVEYHTTACAQSLFKFSRIKERNIFWCVPRESQVDKLYLLNVRVYYLAPGSVEQHIPLGWVAVSLVQISASSMIQRGKRDHVNNCVILGGRYT